MFDQVSVGLMGLFIMLASKYVVHKCPVISKKQDFGFSICSILVSIQILLRLAIDMIVVKSLPGYNSFIVITAAYLFMMSVVIPFVFMFLTFDVRRSNALGMIVLVVLDIVVILTTPFTGWYFSVSGAADFVWGPYYLVHFIVMVYASFSVMIIGWRCRRSRARSDSSIQLMPFITMLLGVVLQLQELRLSVQWTLFAIGLFLYYISVRETMHRVDSLTNFQTRLAFNEDAQQFLAEGAEMYIFTIPDLREYNDIHGHGKGDQLLVKFSGIAWHALGKYSKFYRITGEKICLIKDGKNKAKFFEFIYSVKKMIENDGVTVTVSRGNLSSKKAGVNYECFHLDDRDIFLNIHSIEKECEIGVR